MLGGICVVGFLVVKARRTCLGFRIGLDDALGRGMLSRVELGADCRGLLLAAQEVFQNPRAACAKLRWAVRGGLKGASPCDNDHRSTGEEPKPGP
jgi:hypothetical protein